MSKAVAEVAKLPEVDQDFMAAWILEEIQSERQWSEKFATSQDLLAQLADEALDEVKAEKTRPIKL